MKFLKLYENFDWNEEDFDFEEYPSNKYVSIPDNVVLPKNTKVKIKNKMGLKYKNQVGTIIGYFKDFNILKFVSDVGDYVYKNEFILVRQDILNKIEDEGNI